MQDLGDGFQDSDFIKRYYCFIWILLFDFILWHLFSDLIKRVIRKF